MLPQWLYAKEQQPRKHCLWGLEVGTREKWGSGEGLSLQQGWGSHQFSGRDSNRGPVVGILLIINYSFSVKVKGK